MRRDPHAEAGDGKTPQRPSPSDASARRDASRAESPLSVERDGAVLRVWLDRPERRNALDTATLEALTELYQGLQRDFQTRVVVLGGRGPSFCAGADRGRPPGSERMAASSGAERARAALRCADRLARLPRDRGMRGRDARACPWARGGRRRGARASPATSGSPRRGPSSTCPRWISASRSPGAPRPA